MKLLALLLPLLLTACRATGPAGTPTPACLELPAVREVALSEAADALAACDVVFLGEEHDNDVGHALQLLLTELLLRRRGALALSLEMFERDVQGTLDRYLAGEIDEERFLAESRPWGNYAEHYRPAVELARSRGLPVLAANVPRDLARRVSARGLDAVEGEPHAAREVHLGDGPYRARFAEAITGGHPGFEPGKLDRWYAAQCLKDDTMAESIADFLSRPRGPLVVHWCGSFHSDYGLGTVERLLMRRPDLRVGVVSMISGELDEKALEAFGRDLADYVLLVPPVPAPVFAP